MKARVLAALLALVMLLAAPCAAQDGKVDPGRCYWLSPMHGEVLEARADGRVASRPASSRPGAFWILHPVGDDCFVVTNVLLGPKRALVLGKGGMGMGDGAQKLRIFQWGDRWVMKRPQPTDAAKREAGDVELGDDGVMVVLWPMQRVGAPLPSGSWYVNVGPVSGRVASPRLSPGSLWKVVAPTVAGRARPDPRAPVVRTFTRGTVLQADVGRGGSDEVMWNATDDDGNAWMRVRTRDGRSLDCYVPASTRTIRPVQRQAGANPGSFHADVP